MLLPLTLSANDMERILPADLMSYEYYELPNNMGVYLLPRPGAQTTAIRLRVGAGTYHSPCGKRETAHFLEHMFFEGTSQYSNSDLENWMHQISGGSNAFTYGLSTGYDIDVYAPNTIQALEYLFTIMTDSTLSEEAHARTVDLINDEIDGSGPVGQALYDAGYTKIAIEQYQADAGIICDTYEDASNVSLEDIQQFLADFYRPDNMDLIVVGNFNAQAIKQYLASSFASIPNIPSKPRPEHTINPVEKSYEDTIPTIAGDDRETMVLFRLPGNGDLDLIRLTPIQDWITQEYYNLIRNEHALMYAPSAGMYANDSESYLYFLLSTESDKYHFGMELVESFIAGLPEKVENTDTNALVEAYLKKSALSLETNASYADWIQAGLDYLTIPGIIPDDEALIRSMSNKEYADLIRRHMTPQLRVDIHHQPLMSINQFALFLLLMLLGMILTGYKVHQWRKSHIKHTRR